MDRKADLVVFDLNRTVIHENTWEDLNLAMGVTREEDALFMKWYEEGIVSYEEGQKFLDRIYLSRGKATEQEMAKIMSKYTYREGAKEIMLWLKKQGYKLALISGSIDSAVEKVARDLEIDMWRAHNKLRFDDSGRFLRIECYGDDADFKLDAVKEFCRDLAIEMDQVVCVGDGYNDRKIFEATGRGVTFAGSQVEKDAWKVIKELEDLKEIL